jgi:hypothetical protein
MTFNSKILVLFVLTILSCKKSVVVDPDILVEYEVSTLKSAKTNGLAEGLLSQVDLTTVSSMAIDSKGNIYMADWQKSSVKKLTPDGKITERKIKGQYGSQTPVTLSVSADDEVQVLTLYQQESDLFYYAKNDEPFKAFLNPFPKQGTGFSANTSCVFKKSDGKYIVGVDSKLYSFTNEKTYSDLKMPIVIGGSQLQGNVSFMNSEEKLYYIPEGLYDGDPFVQLKYISKDLVKTIVKAESTLSIKKESYNAGDGLLPKAVIGRISSLCGDNAGNMYFVESASSIDKLRLRKLSKDGTITTLAGGVLDGNIDGIGQKASFQYVGGMTVDTKGNIYISTEAGIRKVSKK